MLLVSFKVEYFGRIKWGVRRIPVQCYSTTNVVYHMFVQVDSLPTSIITMGNVMNWAPLLYCGELCTHS